MKKLFKILCPVILTGAFIMPCAAVNASANYYPEYDNYDGYDYFNSGSPFYREDSYYNEEPDELIEDIITDEEITEEIILDEPVISADTCGCETETTTVTSVTATTEPTVTTSTEPSVTKSKETEAVKTEKPYLKPVAPPVKSVSNEVGSAVVIVPVEIPSPEPRIEVISEERQEIPIVKTSVNEPESSTAPVTADSAVVTQTTAVPLTTNTAPPLINPQGGNGEMIESAVSGDVNREFITVKSKNGAIF